MEDACHGHHQVGIIVGLGVRLQKNACRLTRC
jgi:hypothetical protein